MQCAIYPEADHQLVFLRFDVDVGGPHLHGFLEDRLQQLDHRRFGVVQGDTHLAEIDHPFVAFDLALDVIGIFAKLIGPAVDLVNGAAELVAGNDAETERASDQARQFVLIARIGRVGQPYHVRIATVLQNEGANPARLNFGERSSYFRINVIAPQVDEWHPLLRGNGPGHLLFGDIAVFDQHATENPSGSLLLGQGIAESLLGEIPQPDQRSAKLLGFCYR